MITINLFGVILCLVIGFATAFLIIFLLDRFKSNKRKTRLSQEEAEAKAKVEKIIADANKSGESRKRELLLLVKEEVQKSKITLEQDVRNAKAELNQEKNRLNQKEKDIDESMAIIDKKEQLLKDRESDIDRKQEAVDKIYELKIQELETISQLSKEEARQLILDMVKNEYSLDMAAMYKRMMEDTVEKAEDQAKEILATTIQRFSAESVAEMSVSVVNLPNEEMKGRIIGREGRNIRAFETITGVDIIIDDTPESVLLSCFNPIRREIAKLTIEKLVIDGRIHPARIEEMFDKSRAEVDQVIKQQGERAAFEIGIMGMHPEIIRHLGRLHYRTSHGQNVLQHCMEVGWLAGMMAAELGMDAGLAKRGGLLHDIGKAMDFELEGSHVELGYELAKKYNEPEIVLNAIESHHGDVETTHPISILVAAADALSAARPGARRENLETYIKRLQKLEEIAMDFDGVGKCYAIKAGREIRVMVEPEKVTDEKMLLIAREISKRIEDELSYPGVIKVHLIRETRVTDTAK